jgi:hypothetical protein
VFWCLNEGGGMGFRAGTGGLKMATVIFFFFFFFFFFLAVF